MDNNIRSFEDALFDKWINTIEKSADRDKFCYDGLHYLGRPFQPDERHWEIKEEKGLAESKWEKSLIRCTFLTKDHNDYDGEGVDFRRETGINNDTGKMYHQFYGKWIRLLYGLCNINPIDWSYLDYSDLPDSTKLLETFQTILPCVRINLKKIAGGRSCSPSVLRESIEKDKELIKCQLSYYDANIFVCCDGSDKSTNPIMNLLYEIYPDLVLFDETTKFVYYSPSNHILVLHEWHPSYRGVSYEEYYSAVKVVSIFLKKNQNFLKGFSGFKITH